MSTIWIETLGLLWSALYERYAGSLFYAVCSESKFFRDSGCIFIWSVYVYLLFAGYMSLIRRMKAKSLWNGSLLCMILSFCKRIVDSSNDVLADRSLDQCIFSHPLDYVFCQKCTDGAGSSGSRRSDVLDCRGKYACKSQDQERDRTDRIRQS